MNKDLNQSEKNFITPAYVPDYFVHEEVTWPSEAESAKSGTSRADELTEN
jgi:hypothetical protein